MKDIIDIDVIDAIDRATATKPKVTKSTNPTPAAKAITAPPPAAPSQKLVNPFARYGELEGSPNFFNGDFLKLDQKLSYIRGQNKTPVDTKQGFVTSMLEARHGFVRFGDGRVGHDVYLICEQPELPPCKACGRSGREHDDHPNQCEWKPTVYLPLRPLDDPNDIMCFTGGGKGARIAVGELCEAFGKPGVDRGGRDFVIMLETRPVPNPKGGTTMWPVFRQAGVEFFVPDTPAPPVMLVAVPTTAAAKAPPERGDMDDEIPF